jgi:MoaA/NifB/PqqE/SkfB family radical SAM enzyme
MSDSVVIPGMKNKGFRIISGARLSVVWTGVILTVLKIALKMNHHPVRAFKLLRSLVKERKAIHNNTGRTKALKADSQYYWSVNFPGWPSKKFNYFINNELLRINSPDKHILQTIIFSITNICPLHCIHCYESDNLSDTNRLTLEDLKIVMDKIRDKGIRHIQFSGGEPLSRFNDMIELMNYSGKMNDYWISTSGFGLTYKKALVMKENGLTGAMISLDDWDENRHNGFRGHDKSFYWVQEAAKNCLKAGIIICLSLCPVKDFVTEDNLSRYYLLAKSLGAGFIRIMEPRKAGRFTEKDILLDEKHIDIIEKFMMTRNCNPAYAKYPIILFGGYHQRKTGCYGAGNRYLFIDTNGDLHACPFCRNPLGNILSEPIDTGIDKAKAIGCHLFNKNIQKYN